MKCGLDGLHLKSCCAVALLVWVVAAVAASFLPTLLLLICARLRDDDVHAHWNEVKVQVTGINVSLDDFVYTDGPSWMSQCFGRFMTVVFVSLCTSEFGQKYLRFSDRFQGFWLGLEVACAGLCCSSLLSLCLGTAMENPMACIASATQITMLAMIKAIQYLCYERAGVAVKAKSSAGKAWGKFVRMFPACAVALMQSQLAKQKHGEATYVEWQLATCAKEPAN